MIRQVMRENNYKWREYNIKIKNFSYYNVKGKNFNRGSRYTNKYKLHD